MKSNERLFFFSYNALAQTQTSVQGQSSSSVSQTDGANPPAAAPADPPQGNPPEANPPVSSFVVAALCYLLCSCEPLICFQLLFVNHKSDGEIVRSLPLK